ncbi:MAG: dienelactone hydrolase, partial [Moorea sp. SIO4A3]|nr:dienelactone hydrolase [Moorena sp. SIO4A3]
NQLGGSKYLISAIGGTHLSVTDPKNLNDAIARSTLVKEVVGDDAHSLRQLVKGVSLAFIKQLTPEAQRYEPFLTPAYAQSLSSPKISLRLSTKLPATMATWFQVISVGNQQVAINFNEVNSGSISSNKFYFYPNTKFMTPNTFCIGQLNQLFNKLVNKYREKASRIS